MPSVCVPLRAKNRWPVGVCGLLLVTGVAHAAEPTGVSAIGVDELVRRVETRDPRLAILQARVDRARAEIDAAGRVQNPTLGYGREEVFIDGDGAPEDTLVVSVPIELSGRRAAAVRAARSTLAATEADIAQVRASLVLDAIASYDEAALARTRVTRLQEDRARLATLREVLAKRLAAGQASPLDRTRLDVELATWDDLILGAEADLEGARRRLALIAGEPGALLDASDTASEPTLVPLPDTTRPSERPEYVAAERRREAARHARVAAGRAEVPELVVDAGVRTADVGLGSRAWGYVTGISIELPFFERAPGERARADAEAREAEATMELIAQRAPAEIADAHRALALSIERVATYRAGQRASGEELRRAIETAYREGDRPIFEVVDVYRTTRDLALHELELIARARDAERAFYRALGRRP